MNTFRSTALTLGLLTVFSLTVSNASAHDGCPDLLTASRNLERAMHTLAGDVARQHPYCPTVIDATEHVEDLACNFRTAVSRQVPVSRLQPEFKHLVTDFRSLIGTLRTEGLSPRLERDLLAVRDSMSVVGRFLAWTPQFGHDCDFDHHDDGHGHGHDGHDLEDFPIVRPGQGNFGRGPVRIQPGFKGPAFPGKTNGKFGTPFNAPRGGVSAKVGKVQVQFGVR